MLSFTYYYLSFASVGEVELVVGALTSCLTHTAMGACSGECMQYQLRYTYVCRAAAAMRADQETHWYFLLILFNFAFRPQIASTYCCHRVETGSGLPPFGHGMVESYTILHEAIDIAIRMIEAFYENELLIVQFLHADKVINTRGKWVGQFHGDFGDEWTIFAKFRRWITTHAQ